MVAMRSVKRLLEHLNNNPSCAKPRTLVSYEVFPKEVFLPTGPMGGLSQVYLYYETTDVTMDQEYLRRRRPVQRRRRDHRDAPGMVRAGLGQDCPSLALW